MSDSRDTAANPELEPPVAPFTAVDEEKTPTEKDSAGKTPRKPRKHKNPLSFSLLALWLTVLLLASALGFTGLYQYPKQQARLQKKLLGLEQGLQASQQDSTTANTRLGELINRYEEDTGALRGQVTALQEDNRLLQENLLSLRNKLGSNNTQWQVAEVEYLLQIANHRVQLERDVGTALAALRAADDRLQRLSDPRFTELRGILAKDIQTLAAVQTVDTTGIVMELAAIESEVGNLPVISHSQFEFAAPGDKAMQAEKGSSSWSNTLQTAWHDIKQLVVIRQRDKPVEPLLPPDQQKLLLDNIRLQLAAARMAVLKQDTASFKLEVAKTVSWLESYFDQQHGAVSAMTKALGKYRDVELKPELPDVSASLLALRQWKTDNSKNKP